MRERDPLHPRARHASPSFCVLRSPRWPFETLRAITADAPDDVEASEVDDDVLERLLARCTERAEQRLRALAEDPALSEALRLASPSLHAAVQRGRGGARTQDATSVARGLLKYVSRMASRATPRGLCAGHAVVAFGPRGALARAGADAIARSTTLDAGYADRLAREIARVPAIASALSYALNTSLHRSGDELCLARASRSDDEGRRSYAWLTLAPSAELDLVVCRLRGGEYRSLDALRALLRVDAGLSITEADAYVEALREHDVIVSELAEIHPAEPRLEQLVRVLARVAPQHPCTEALRHVRQLLGEMDGSARARTEDVSAAVASALAPLATVRGKLVDASITLKLRDAVLDPSVSREILRGAQLLSRLRGRPSDTALARFAACFVERYGQRDVPLLEALDVERGIGFDEEFLGGHVAAPLIDDMPPTEGDSQARVDPFTALVQRAGRARGGGVPELVLDEADLHDLGAHDDEQLPDAFVAHARIVASSLEAVRQGDYRVLVGSYEGPSASWAFGRLALHDPALRARLRELAEDEAKLHPDALVADLVYAPHGAVLGVVQRPSVRAWAIEYLGRSDLAPSRRLHVDDLVLRVRGGAISLWSRRLGRRVVVRSTTAHAASAQSFLVYRFLRALEADGGRHCGSLSPSSPGPRVRMGRIVLREASWRVPAACVAALGRASTVVRFRAVQALRRKESIPRWVSVGAEDEWLTLDLAHPVGCDLLIRELGRAPDSLVRELYPPPDRLFLHDGADAYGHELWVPFVRPAPTERSAIAGEPAPTTSEISLSLRRYVPGREWLSVHLYAAPAVVDRLLVEVVAPCAREAAPHVERLFFLRYGEPSFHLRLRFRGDPERLMRDVYGALLARLEPFLRSEAVFQLELATYDRELERFGGEVGMELAEEIFDLDSRRALEVLPACRDDGSGEVRWQQALIAMDTLLRAFCPTREEALAALDCHRQYTADVSRRGPSAVRQLSQRHGRERARIARLLASHAAADRDPTRALARTARRLHALARESDRAAELPGWVATFVHLTVNRMMVSHHLLQEWVMAELLRRAYRAELERARPALGDGA